MAALKPEFVEGCRANGVSAERHRLALGRPTRSSADYSFNKSHAACYALIAYRTAWLKANYPAEYMAALISSVMDTKDKVPFFVAQAEGMGIEILPPDVNLSDHEFVVVDGNIRFGLDAVKGVGFAAVEAIKAAREEGGPFASIWDFCTRVDPRAVNKRAIEALDQVRRVRLDGRDAQGHARACSSRRRPPARRRSSTPQIGQGSIFDLGDSAATPATPAPPSRLRAPQHPPIPPEEFDQARAAGRREGGHRALHLRAPAQGGARGAARRGRRPLAALPDRSDGDWVTAGRHHHRRPRRSARRRATR